jgi:histidinol-phosphate aminotransferase
MSDSSQSTQPTEQVRIRADIEAMEAYTPTTSLESFAERLGYDVSELVKLDANENPFGPTEGVKQALADISGVAVYPDPEAKQLRSQISDYIGVDAKHILVGAGADEIIELVLQLFIEPGDTILNCPPTFAMYSFDAPLAHAKIVNIPRNDDFSLNVEAIEQAAHETGAKLLFLCSPNNPSGNTIPTETVKRLLDLPLTVVLDEAYIEFSRQESMVQRVPDTPNLIVMRTMSKWAALAGLRVGYGVFHESLMPHLWKIKQPYNLNVAGDVAARAALDDLPLLLQRVQTLIDLRGILYEVLNDVPYLAPYPSESNFILCRVRGLSAEALRDKLAQDEGIIIRYYKKPGLDDCVRFSVGTPQQIDRLTQALQQIADTLPADKGTLS